MNWVVVINGFGVGGFCMSEKRFKVSIDSNNGVGLFDNSVRLIFIKFTNKKDAVRCKNSLMYQCNLMNGLYEEKEQLKIELESSETTSDATSHYNAFLESKISTLEKENEQLRQVVDYWQKKYEEGTETFVSEKLNELYEENEELREILNKIEEAIEKRGYDSIDEFW